MALRTQNKVVFSYWKLNILMSFNWWSRRGETKKPHPWQKCKRTHIHSLKTSHLTDGKHTTENDRILLHAASKWKTYWKYIWWNWKWFEDISWVEAACKSNTSSHNWHSFIHTNASSLSFLHTAIHSNTPSLSFLHTAIHSHLPLFGFASNVNSEKKKKKFLHPTNHEAKYFLFYEIVNDWCKLWIIYNSSPQKWFINASNKDCPEWCRTKNK